jgi:hypothetical protein
VLARAGGERAGGFRLPPLAAETPSPVPSTARIDAEEFRE